MTSSVRSGQTQSKISRHLRYLYNAGLVEDRRQGLWMHYRVSTKLKPEQATILAALSKAVSDEHKAELQGALEQWFAEKTSDISTGERAAACC